MAAEVADQRRELLRMGDLPAHQQRQNELLEHVPRSPGRLFVIQRRGLYRDLAPAFQPVGAKADQQARVLVLAPEAGLKREDQRKFNLSYFRPRDPHLCSLPFNRNEQDSPASPPAHCAGNIGGPPPSSGCADRRAGRGASQDVRSPWPYPRSLQNERPVSRGGGKIELPA